MVLEENDNLTVSEIDPKQCTDESPEAEADAELAKLCDRLIELGVKKVKAEYSDFGNECPLDDVRYAFNKGFGAPVPKWINKKLRELIDRYIPDRIENNEGVHGDITIYPSLGVARRSHYDHWTDSEALVITTDLPVEIQQKLTEFGMLQIEAEYSGCSDDGEIYGFKVKPGNLELSDELFTELDHLLSDMLLSDFNDNETTRHGSILIDVAAGVIEIDGRWNTNEEDEHVTSWKWRS